MDGKLKSQFCHCLVVLGMHRSGTSAITGILHKLGLQLGNDLLEPVDGVNPKGFWEHAQATALNESILEQLGSYWADVNELSEKIWASAELQTYKETLQSLIQREFAHAQYWGVKDPRLCRLLPLWNTVLAENEIPHSALLIVRHPIEVANSLFARDGIGQTHALLLWMRYILDSEKHSRDIPRLVVTYDELLRDWRTTLLRVIDGLSIPLEINKNHTAVDEFLDLKLKHHTVPDFPNNAVTNLAISIYKDMAASNFRNMQEYANQLKELIRADFSWIEEVNYLNRQLRSSDSANFLLQANTNSLKAEVLRLRSTYSWRVTKPLRWAYERYTKLTGN